jgi:hypothetical protein
MANQYDEYDDDDFDTEEANGPANLRKALKRAEREAKQLKDELASLRSESRTRTVKDVLETKGVNSKIAAFIPADVDTPEKIAMWIEEYADVFGLAAQSTNETVEAPDAARRIQESTSSASTPAQDEDMATRLSSVNSKEELDQLIFGMSTGR